MLVSGFIPLLLAGCPSTNLLNQILTGQISQLTAEYAEQAQQLMDPNVIVTIRIINKSGIREELDLLVDNEPTTIYCESGTSIADWVISPCPSRIELVQERRVDEMGNWKGARNFGGLEEYIFTGEEFECGSYLLLELSDTETKATIH